MYNYVEDTLGNFRLNYSKEKLIWALASPGYIKHLQFLIRNSKNKKIMGCTFGLPKKMTMNGKQVKIIEGNFLTVHKKLREKRMAQTIITEVLRRQRKLGYNLSLYTSGKSMPTPFVTVHYMNRFLNVQRLVDGKYTNAAPGVTMKDFEKKYRLPNRDGIKINGVIRHMTKKDLARVHKLFTD